MKRKLTQFSLLYASALQKCLEPGGPGSLRAAGGLGRQAVSLGMETLDLAKVHASAMATLHPIRGNSAIQQSENFFNEAATPIEQTHRAALKANSRLRTMNETLARRTARLNAAKRFLKQGVASRRITEKALKTSGVHSETLLKRSGQLESQLRQLTRYTLSAQEEKRRKISHQLQDEIVQILLGINVRLLSLKETAATNAAGLQKEIASTRQLLDRSMKTIKRFSRAFGKGHETQD
jgi:two-component system, NarL family, sensor histidine kinase DegS